MLHCWIDIARGVDLEGQDEGNRAICVVTLDGSESQATKISKQSAPGTLEWNQRLDFSSIPRSSDQVGIRVVLEVDGIDIAAGDTVLSVVDGAPQCIKLDGGGELSIRCAVDRAPEESSVEDTTAPTLPPVRGAESPETPVSGGTELPPSDSTVVDGSVNSNNQQQPLPPIVTSQQSRPEDEASSIPQPKPLQSQPPENPSPMARFSPSPPLVAPPKPSSSRPTSASSVSSPRTRRILSGRRSRESRLSTEGSTNHEDVRAPAGPPSEVDEAQEGVTAEMGQVDEPNLQQPTPAAAAAAPATPSVEASQPKLILNLMDCTEEFPDGCQVGCTVRCGGKQHELDTIAVAAGSLCTWNFAEVSANVGEDDTVNIHLHVTLANGEAAYVSEVKWKELVTPEGKELKVLEETEVVVNIISLSIDGDTTERDAWAEKAAGIFKSMDKDSSQTLTPDEVLRTLQSLDPDANEDNATQFLTYFDTQHVDGVIDEQEFMVGIWKYLESKFPGKFTSQSLSPMVTIRVGARLVSTDGEAEVPNDPNTDNEDLETTIDRIFDHLDTDGSGTISTSEVLAVLTEIDSRFKEEDAANFIKVLDKDRSGQLDKQEFKEGVIKHIRGDEKPSETDEPPRQPDKLGSIFQQLDSDSSGSITTEEAVSSLSLVDPTAAEADAEAFSLFFPEQSNITEEAFRKCVSDYFVDKESRKAAMPLRLWLRVYEGNEFPSQLAKHSRDASRALVVTNGDACHKCRIPISRRPRVFQDFEFVFSTAEELKSGSINWAIEESSASEKTVLASSTIPLWFVSSEMQSPVEGWMPLQPTKAVGDECTPILLTKWFVGAVGAAPVGFHETFDSPTTKALPDNDLALVKTDIVEPSRRRIRSISLRVPRAKDLAAADEPPYFSVALGNFMQESAKASEKTVDPVWNEMFEFTGYLRDDYVASIEDEQANANALLLKRGDLGLVESKIVLNVMDLKPRTPDDVLGSATLDLNTLSEGQEKQMWLPLGGPKQGMIQVIVTISELTFEQPILTTHSVTIGMVDALGFQSIAKDLNYPLLSCQLSLSTEEDGLQGDAVNTSLFKSTSPSTINQEVVLHVQSEENQPLDGDVQVVVKGHKLSDLDVGDASDMKSVGLASGTFNLSSLPPGENVKEGWLDLNPLPALQVAADSHSKFRIYVRLRFQLTGRGAPPLVKDLMTERETTNPSDPVVGAFRLHQSSHAGLASFQGCLEALKSLTHSGDERFLKELIDEVGEVTTFSDLSSAYNSFRIQQERSQAAKHLPSFVLTIGVKDSQNLEKHNTVGFKTARVLAQMGNSRIETEPVKYTLQPTFDQDFSLPIGVSQLRAPIGDVLHLAIAKKTRGSKASTFLGEAYVPTWLISESRTTVHTGWLLLNDNNRAVAESSERPRISLALVKHGHNDSIQRLTAEKDPMRVIFDNADVEGVGFLSPLQALGAIHAVDPEADALEQLFFGEMCQKAGTEILFEKFMKLMDNYWTTVNPQRSERQRTKYTQTFSGAIISGVLSLPVHIPPPSATCTVDCGDGNSFTTEQVDPPSFRPEWNEQFHFEITVDGEGKEERMLWLTRAVVSVRGDEEIGQSQFPTKGLQLGREKAVNVTLRASLVEEGEDSTEEVQGNVKMSVSLEDPYVQYLEELVNAEKKLNRLQQKLAGQRVIDDDEEKNRSLDDVQLSGEWGWRVWTKPLTCIATHFTADLKKSLSGAKTLFGVTLSDITQLGIEYPDHPIGLMAGDEFCYSLFRPLLEPSIKDIFGVDGRDPLPPPRFDRYIPSDGIQLPPFPSEYFDHVACSRVRVCRNLKGLPFSMAINAEQREKLRVLCEKALPSTPPRKPGTGKGHSLSGRWYWLDRCSSEELDTVVGCNALMHFGDEVLQCVGVERDAPQGRGVYVSHDRHFVVWAGGEEHLRMVATYPSVSWRKLWKVVWRGVAKFESAGAVWATSARYGHLATNLANVQHGMRLSIHVGLPHIMKKGWDFLEQECRRIGIDAYKATNVDGSDIKVERSGMEAHKNVKNIVELYNAPEWGLSEYSMLERFHRCARSVLYTERMLEEEKLRIENEERIQREREFLYKTAAWEDAFNKTKYKTIEDTFDDILTNEKYSSPKWKEALGSRFCPDGLTRLEFRTSRFGLLFDGLDEEDVGKVPLLDLLFNVSQLESAWEVEHAIKEFPWLGEDERSNINKGQYVEAMLFFTEYMDDERFESTTLPLCKRYVEVEDPRLPAILKCYKHLDKTKTGYLSLDEITALCAQGEPIEMLRSARLLMQAMDDNCDWMIQEEEYVDWLLDLTNGLEWSEFEWGMREVMITKPGLSQEETRVACLQLCFEHLDFEEIHYIPFTSLVFSVSVIPNADLEDEQLHRQFPWLEDNTDLSLSQQRYVGVMTYFSQKLQYDDFVARMDDILKLSQADLKRQIRSLQLAECFKHRYLGVDGDGYIRMEVLLDVVKSVRYVVDTPFVYRPLDELGEADVELINEQKWVDTMLQATARFKERDFEITISTIKQRSGGTLSDTGSVRSSSVVSMDEVGSTASSARQKRRLRMRTSMPPSTVSSAGHLDNPDSLSPKKHPRKSPQPDISSSGRRTVTDSVDDERVSSPIEISRASTPKLIEVEPDSPRSRSQSSYRERNSSSAVQDASERSGAQDPPSAADEGDSAT